jgi:hypothetical protein
MTNKTKLEAPIEVETPVEHAIVILNEAFKLDSRTIDWLINNRVPCHSELSKHSTIQVRTIRKNQPFGGTDPVKYEVGMLDILNGILDSNIAADYSEDTGKLIGFKEVIPPSDKSTEGETKT